MNKSICETNKQAPELLSKAQSKWEAERNAEYEAEIAKLQGYEKYIPDLCYILAGCVEPTKANADVFPHGRGARLVEYSVLGSLCHFKAIDEGLTFEDNPYSHDFNLYSDGSSGIASSNLTESERKARQDWERNVLYPQINANTGREYYRKYDGGMFGDYWLVPKDETVREYMSYKKEFPLEVLLMPLIGQIYLMCLIWSLIVAIFTKKWFANKA